MGTIITVDDLASRLGEPNLRIVDCRSALGDDNAGRLKYKAAHLPTAQYADLGLDMSAEVIPGKTGRHPLPERDSFADFLSHVGIDNDSSVVAYDDGTGAFASRFWWMMRWLGHEDVQVLTGGFKAWSDAGLPVTDEVDEITPTDFQIFDSLTKMVSANSIMDTGAMIIDARDRSRFLGEADPIDPVAGHIPGAICVPFSGNVNEDATLRSAEELKARFEEAGVSSDKPVVCYCGSGVTAAHNILAMLHAGFDEPALYPGSWSEWITDPARPVETG